MASHAERSPAEEVGDPLTIKTWPFFPDPSATIIPSLIPPSASRCSGARAAGRHSLPSLACSPTCLRATRRQMPPIAPNENSLVASGRPEVGLFASWVPLASRWAAGERVGGGGESNDLCEFCPRCSGGGMVEPPASATETRRNPARSGEGLAEIFPSWRATSPCFCGATRGLQ